jgi:hypothetical protein
MITELACNGELETHIKRLLKSLVGRHRMGVPVYERKILILVRVIFD